MIIINEKNFDNVLKKVSFGEYNVIQDGKKRNWKLKNKNSVLYYL